MADDTTKIEGKTFEETYLLGNYEEALRLLDLQGKANPSGVYHYNRGVLSLKLENPALARYHLEKSIALGHINQDSLTNLKIAKDKLGTHYWTQELSWSDQMISSLLSAPFALWGVSAALLLCVWAYVLRRKKLTFQKGLLFLCLALSPLFLGLTPRLFFQRAITLSEITAKEGPSELYENSTEIPAGMALLLDEEREGWYHIQGPSAVAGWVRKKFLGLY